MPEYSGYVFYIGTPCQRYSQASLEKNQAENTEIFDAKRKACSQVLVEEYK